MKTEVLAKIVREAPPLRLAVLMMAPSLFASR